MSDLREKFKNLLCKDTFWVTVFIMGLSMRLIKLLICDYFYIIGLRKF